MSKIYHKEHCQSIVRQVHELGKIVIILAGQHAFKYSITIKKPESTKSMTFCNRDNAIKEISNLKKQYRQFGDVCLRY